MNALDSLSRARALYYDFFAGLFLYELLCERSSVLLNQVKILKENAFNEHDSVHFELLQSELERRGVEQILREYTNTFLLSFSVPKAHEQMPMKRKKGKQPRKNTQVMLYLSHYLEGCLNGKALLKARQLTKKSTFRLNTKECKESEEHLGFLLLLMRHLLLSQDEADKALCAEVSKELVIPLGDFVTNVLSQREDLSYYASVGSLLQSFLNVERALG
ncbi:hypothetical protein LS71_002130 [Helicobacter jaachi]|uniref:Molecular chaperone TorD family protein n=1 Tax=Helicobacter jaachi TaxID=1677920 RepID=A0A4U8TFU0_9HELI|nr:molecular chaperone TorD family protein [Helicobacter jaachi]TLD97567.1 hypothetical protein LS71_002130 [Helicobacter jaachi]